MRRSSSLPKQAMFLRRCVKAGAGAAFYALSILLCAACLETPKEKLDRLHKISVHKQAKYEKVQEAYQEIKELLHEKNEQKSQYITKVSSPRLVRVSPNRKLLVWIDHGHLYSWDQKQKTSWDISQLRDRQFAQSDLIDIKLSWSGRYLTLLYYKEKACLLQALDSKEQQELKLPALGRLDCYSSPILTDDASMLFYSDKKELVSLRLASGQKQTGEGAQSAGKTHLINLSKAVKYSKIQNSFYLYAAGPYSVFIFLGNAGYYRLYYYQYHKSQESYKLKSYNKPFASSQFHYARIEWSPDREKTNKGGIAKYQVMPKKEKLGLYAADVFLYSGAIGNWKLHSLTLDRPSSLGPAFRAETADDLVFLEQSGVFLLLQKNKLYAWDPISREKQRYPIELKALFPFYGGIVYIDFANRIYLRHSAYSDFEWKLMYLHHTIEERQENLSNLIPISPSLKD